MVATAVAAAELRAWTPPDEGQEALRHALLAFLDARPDDACDRSCVPGHLTASALVLDADGEHTLLTLHPRVGRWVQLGGHCEPGDASLRDAALREATEESGIDGLVIEAGPVHVDVHPVTCSSLRSSPVPTGAASDGGLASSATCSSLRSSPVPTGAASDGGLASSATRSPGVPTRHLDVRFLVRAPAGAVARISAESDDLRWWPLAGLPPDCDTVPAMVAVAVGRAGQRQNRSSS